MTSSLEARRYKNDKEVDEAIRKFESCEFTPSEFTHAPHLTVALEYLLSGSEHEALERMRKSIMRFIDHHQLDQRVYNETMTVFWMKRVRAFIIASGEKRPRVALANELLAMFSNSQLIFEYYSKELVQSDRARREWTEPDLKHLEF
jgi:hypothetical protein